MNGLLTNFVQQDRDNIDTLTKPTVIIRNIFINLNFGDSFGSEWSLHCISIG